MHSTRNSRIEKAERGLSLLKQAIIELLRASPGGLRNTDIAKDLNLESAHAGGHRNFLTYSVLGQLIEQGSVEERKDGNETLYTLRKGQGHPRSSPEPSPDKVDQTPAIILPDQDQWFRYWMPYHFKKLEVRGREHVYLPLNRNYKPLGKTSREHVNFEEFSAQAMVFQTDPHAFEHVWHLEGLYLYDDSARSWSDYFVRLGRLLSQRVQVLEMAEKYSSFGS